jgi:pimeloyl-ACP methyl ester carboxylesterase
LADNLDTINTPTLLITGDHDTVVPTKDTVKLEKLIAGSSLVLIKNSAHLPQEEQPEAFMEAISSNWESLVSK